MNQMDVISQKPEQQESQVSDIHQDHGLRVLLILSLLMAFASISTDLYLPAMPEMAQALNVSGGALQFTVTGYLIGLCPLHEAHIPSDYLKPDAALPISFWSQSAMM
ncbi:hypothetical protein HU761_18900, partial [Pseudomonas sp. SWRI59]|nr:hypothetical protein [Pseudomonas sp. SWRI59]